VALRRHAAGRAQEFCVVLSVFFFECAAVAPIGARWLGGCDVAGTVSVRRSGWCQPRGLRKVDWGCVLRFLLVVVLCTVWSVFGIGLFNLRVLTQPTQQRTPGLAQFPACALILPRLLCQHRISRMTGYCLFPLFAMKTAKQTLFLNGFALYENIC
jgi:hypothetical protein